MNANFDKGDKRSEDHNPQQRSSDENHWLFAPKRNLYRDFWLFAITIVVLLALTSARDATDQAKKNTAQAEKNSVQARELSAQNRNILMRIQEGREQAVRESCTTDQILVDIDRRILLDALARARARGRGPEAKQAAKFYDEVLHPLGGLKILAAKKQKAQCDARVRRASATPSG